MINKGKQIQRQSSNLRKLLEESKEQEEENHEDVILANIDVDLAVETVEEEFQELKEAED